MAGFGITTAGTSQLLFRPGLMENFWETYQNYAPEWKQIVKFGTTDKVELQMARIAGPSRMYRSGEGEPPVLSTITVSDKVTAVDREYQGGYGVTLRAREDDLYGKLNQGAKYLANAGNYLMEYQVGGLLDDLATGAIFPGMDGLPVLSASHPLMNSSILQGNLGPTPVAFSQAGVNQLAQLAANARDENGDPIQVRLDTLIIPNDVGIKQDAYRMFQQQMEFATANHNDNPNKITFDGMKIITSHFMTSQSNYYMMDSRLNDLHLLVRKPLTMRDWMDMPTQTQFVASRIRFMLFAYNWRGIYGMIPS